jgi:hypothetical protein
MPQMKRLKELKLPVGNETETGRYGGSSVAGAFTATALSALPILRDQSYRKAVGSKQRP